MASELRDLESRLSRKWSVGGGRMTRKRAEAASLLALYRDVVVILDRMDLEGVPAVAHMIKVVKGPSTKSDLHGEIAATQVFLPRFAVDLKSLYHWSYAIEDFLNHSSIKTSLDLGELHRVALFRHKLMVHYGRTPMRKRGRVPLFNYTWGPEPDNFRLMAHPGLQPGLWSGQRRKVARLNRHVPGLKAETNLFAKIDLIYRHLNSIPAIDQGWVRDELLGTVGIWSDTPALVGQALLDVLKRYVAVKRL